jgi:tetratricopeptide (TPR) repeat protein
MRPGYIEQDPAALDSYESRFWLADARYWIVVLQSALGQNPSDAEVTSARHAAMDVRDSTEDDRYLQPSAYYVVSIADNLLEDRYRAYAASKGARSFPKREAVEFLGSGSERRPVRAELPSEVAAAIEGRDDYNKSIAFEADPQKNGRLYAFQAADFLFVYGHFPEARERLQPMMDEHCGKDEWGYKAWEKLISMSNFEGDADQSRALVEGKSCAFDEETLAAEDALRKPVRQGVAYLDARKVYDEAERMSDGPERDKKWRQAAAAYKIALDAAPDRDEAPEAAMNGAFAYKQVGEYDKAIEMYELFISRYGNDAKLFALRDGDTGKTPPTEPDPAKYQDRARYLKLAYDALASSYVLFFDYPKASATFDKIGRNPHFSAAERRDAARQSLTLAASLGDSARMQGARSEFAALQASPEQLAEADFVVASSTLKGWDQLSPDSGANKNARIRAERAMGDYYAANGNNPAAAQYSVEAAYWGAKLKHASRDARGEAEWWAATKGAFERYRQVAPKRPDGTSQALGSRQAGFAAEGAYTLIDDEIRKGFDYDTGHHRYAGTTVEVLGQYRKGAADAQKYYDQLQATIEAYASPEWATAAIARQGSLYDSLRTALYNAQPPALKMFDKRTEALLARAENSDNLDLQEQADTIRMKVQTAWQEARDRELESADQVMVDRYGNAITLARRYNVSNPTIVRAIQRLAFFTDVIGEAKLAQYTSRVKDLGYNPGMFLRIRPGLITAPEAQGLTPPEPLQLEP